MYEIEGQLALVPRSNLHSASMRGRCTWPCHASAIAEVASKEVRADFATVRQGSGVVDPDPILHVGTYQLPSISRFTGRMDLGTHVGFPCYSPC